MDKRLIFSDGFFSNVLKIKDGKIQIGKLESKRIFLPIIFAQIENESFYFKKEKVFKKIITIYDETEFIIGIIEFPLFRFHADIRFADGNNFTFIRDKRLEGNWNIMSETSREIVIKIDNQLFTNEGSIRFSENESSKLLMTSLFLNKYFPKIAIGRPFF